MPMIGRQPPAQMTWVFSANDHEGARRARREFASYIKRCRAPQDAISDSALIFGELVGNAVRHVGGQVRAELTLSGTQPVLCVSDTDPHAPIEIPPAAPESETGRGLKIVTALARKVWIERGKTAKMVCASLPCDLHSLAQVEKGEIGP
jgi:anti-sigma regulatory factor (Ser/Thr protein kinase)